MQHQCTTSNNNFGPWTVEDAGDDQGLIGATGGNSEDEAHVETMTAFMRLIAKLCLL